MSTKTETKTTNQYDPASMGQYQQNHGGATNVFSDYMKDPLKASYFLNQLSLINKQAQGQGQSNINTFLSNARTSGMGDNAGFLQSNLARIGRGTMANQSQGMLQALMGAEANRRGAASMAIQDRPLQTGQDTTQQQSGLGTWLPQVIGGGLGIATSFMGGGMGAAKGPTSSPVGAGMGAGTYSGMATPGYGGGGSYWGVGSGYNPFQQG